MKAFNLDEALAGKPVVTRDGRSVKIAGYNPDAEDSSVIAGWLNNCVNSWHKDGRYWNERTQDYDLFMAPTERKEWVVRKKTYEFIETVVFDSYESAKNAADKCGASIHEITIIE